MNPPRHLVKHSQRQDKCKEIRKSEEEWKMITQAMYNIKKQKHPSKIENNSQTRPFDRTKEIQKGSQPTEPLFV